MGSSICVAYHMWVHLKVRHLDIYCWRVVSVVSVTFLAKPFPPLHQLPFWLQQTPQFCPCDVEHKSHHKVFEATCTQGCIIEFPLTGVSKVYRIVKTDERLMSMTTATAPNVEALIWCNEWSSSREVVEGRVIGICLPASILMSSLKWNCSSLTCFYEDIYYTGDSAILACQCREQREEGRPSTLSLFVHSK